MNNEKKKGSFKSTALTCFGLGLGAFALVGIVGVATNSKSNINNYTQEQYEQQYINGYNDGYNNSFKDKEKLQEQFSTLKVDYISLTNDYNSTLILYNELLENSTIDKSTISNLENQLSICSEKLLNAKAELDYYISLNYNTENTYCISFYDQNKLIDIVYITKGTSLTYDKVPTKKYYKFVGYSLDNENVIDLEELEINEDTNLYALFEFDINGNYTFNVDYKLNNTIGSDKYYSIVANAVISNDTVVSCSCSDVETACFYSPNKDFYLLNGYTLVLNITIRINNIPAYLSLGFNFNADTNSWEYVEFNQSGMQSYIYDVTSATLELE